MGEIPQTSENWNWYQKILLRFFSVFFSLFIFINPNALLIFFLPLYNLYVPFLQQVNFLVGKHLLQIEQDINFSPTGSGDTLASYIYLLVIFIVSLVSTIFWSMFEKNGQYYKQLLYWVTTMIRYYLAITMILYGISKILKIQFPDPSLLVLKETFGNSSPMGLAWTFFGYSRSYNYFLGIIELCSAFLLFRRTALFGALITFFVSVNIMMLNYTFGIPVKILSTSLVIMSAFMLVEHRHRLINFFFNNAIVMPSDIRYPYFKKKWKNICRLIFKYSLLLYIMIFSVFYCLDILKTRTKESQQFVLLGMYRVSEFKSSNNSKKWNSFTLRPDSIIIKFENQERISFAYEIDVKDRKLDASGKNDFPFSLNYSNYDTGQVLLEGYFDSGYVKLKMQFESPIKSKLMGSGFRWVIE